ncbi:MAG: alpha/beta hydrolase [Acidimicrobiaceae bacterium]|nr:alpha/beta hydrolase [Acidimicrobiaceae bacterium]MBO0709059.1 alpha/beta hydrolase [Candidatus Dormibacteraeota bacterium]
MTAPPLESTIDLTGGPVEVLEWPGRPDRAPIVMLHEGLGSARLWRFLPAALAAGTGRRTIAWSRHGYGWSAPAPLPRRPSYMHDEAKKVLPEFLAAIEIKEPVLIGHSDGASIALIHAGAGHPVESIVAIAPHAFVEDVTIAGIEEARLRFTTSDLPSKMAKHHTDAEATFRGWNDIWLSTEFRDWSIEDHLSGVRCPLLLIQAADDPYGTIDQLNRIEAGVAGPVQRLNLEEGGHSPHLMHSEEVVKAAIEFLASPPRSK